MFILNVFAKYSAYLLLVAFGLRSTKCVLLIIIKTALVEWSLSSSCCLWGNAPENHRSHGLSSHVIFTGRLKAVRFSASCSHTVRHWRDYWCLSVHICTHMWVCECLTAHDEMRDEREASQNKASVESHFLLALKVRLILVFARENEQGDESQHYWVMSHFSQISSSEAERHQQKLEKLSVYVDCPCTWYQLPVGEYFAF